MDTGETIFHTFFVLDTQDGRYTPEDILDYYDFPEYRVPGIAKPSLLPEYG